MFRVVGLTKSLFQNANIGFTAIANGAVSRSLSSGGKTWGETMPDFKPSEVATEKDFEENKLERDRFSSAMTSHKEESPEEFDQRFIDEFNRPDLDGWYVRRGKTRINLKADLVSFIKILFFF